MGAVGYLNMRQSESLPAIVLVFSKELQGWLAKVRRCTPARGLSRQNYKIRVFRRRRLIGAKALIGRKYNIKEISIGNEGGVTQPSPLWSFKTHRGL